MAKVDEIREMFPALHREVYGKPLVYLDNAATTQRPQSVIERWVSLTQNSTANIHRAVHTTATEMTEAYEAAREAVRSFINAGSREEVIFTSGTTASINLVAFSFGEAFVHKGDEIIVSEAEHHSNIVPWQLLCERKGAVLKVLPVDETGHLRVGEMDALLSERTRIVAVSHISNVLGLVNPVREVVAKCHERRVPVLLDGAQAVAHQKVDVQELDCDFYVFSGHKMFTATGTGVLYGKKRWLEQMPPYMSGGEMIESVKFSGTTFAPLPQRFEAGTQNFTNAATIVEAIECTKKMQEVGDKAIVEFVLDKLLSFNNIRLFGLPKNVGEKVPVFSFAVEGAHHEDIALLLDKMGIAVRSGQMCAEPLMDRFGVTGMVRASFAQYNSLEEAEYFISSLRKAIDMLV